MSHARRETRGDYGESSHRQLTSENAISHGNDLQFSHGEVRSGYISRDRYIDEGRSESGNSQPYGQSYSQPYEQRSRSSYPASSSNNKRDDIRRRDSDIPHNSREVGYGADSDPLVYRKGSITSIGNSEDKAAKKIKQAEYAQYLINQMQAREQRDSENKVGYLPPRKLSVDSRSNAEYLTTGESVSRSLVKVEKEAGYATELQQYQHLHDQDRHKYNIAEKLDGGHERMERLQYYDREQPYDNELSIQQRQSQQSQLRPRMRQDEHSSPSQERAQYNTSSFSSPGHSRQGVARYLDADIPDTRPGPDSVRGSPAPSPTVPSAADYRREEISTKRAKQAEYAQSLLNQQQYRKQQQQQQQQQQHPSKISFLTSDTHDDAIYRSNPSNQNRRSDEAMTDKELKRAKQLEYAQALESQLMQQQQSPSPSSGSRSRRSYSPLSSKYAPDRDRDSTSFNLDDPSMGRNRGGRLTGHDRSGRLEEGWTIGPLGQPVRKTLEVGHRGVQKAFNQSLKHSETYTMQREDRDGVGGDDYLSELMNGRLKSLESAAVESPDMRSMAHEQYVQGRGQQQEQEFAFMDEGNYSPDTRYGTADDVRGGLRDSLGTLRAHSFEPRTALNADVLDERKLKAKVMQSEQARALQQQMKDKAARAAAEKEKMEMDDLKEMARLEMERVAMVKAFERDQQADKKTADDENKSALLYQAEEKKRLKEAEERRIAERDRIDERKLQDERELVRRRELAEVERERNTRGRTPVSRTGAEGGKFSRGSGIDDAPPAQPRGSERERMSNYTDMERHPAGHSVQPAPAPSSSSQRDSQYGSSSRKESAREKEVFEKSMRGTSHTESIVHNTWGTDRRYNDSEYDTVNRNGSSSSSSSSGSSSSSAVQGNRDRRDSGAMGSFSRNDGRDQNLGSSHTSGARTVSGSGSQYSNSNSNSNKQLNGARSGECLHFLQYSVLLYVSRN